MERESARKISISLVDQLLDLKGDAKGRVNGEAVIDLLLKAVGPAIGERVKTKREELRLSQLDLATSLKSVQSEVAKIESGQRAISVETAKTLAAALKVSPEWILTGKNR